MNLSCVQALYRGSSARVRDAFAGNTAQATLHYRRYAQFVLRHVSTRPARALDVGCGNGWSTFLLRQGGLDACGADLHSGPLEARQINPSIPYVSADVQQLPF